jgi:hypothetical protein
MAATLDPILLMKPLRDTIVALVRCEPGRADHANPALVAILRNPATGAAVSALPSPDNRFQVAAGRAAAPYGADWLSLLTPTERADAIYRELRRLDAEAVTAAAA